MQKVGNIKLVLQEAPTLGRWSNACGGREPGGGESQVRELSQQEERG